MRKEQMFELGDIIQKLIDEKFELLAKYLAYQLGYPEDEILKLIKDWDSKNDLDI